MTQPPIERVNGFVRAECPNSHCDWARLTLRRRNAILLRDIHLAHCPYGERTYVRTRRLAT